MTVEACEQQGKTEADHAFRTPMGRLTFLSEFLWFRRNIVKRFELRRGQRILVISSGDGFYTNLLSRMGFDAVGVDGEQQKVAQARLLYPKRTFLCCPLSALSFDGEGFDVALAHDCACYRDEPFGREAAHTTASVLRDLRPGGIFVMVAASRIAQDREGSAGSDSILSVYRRHLAMFGESYTVSVVGSRLVCGLYRQEAVTPGVLAAEGRSASAGVS
jgi:SAM-dependent methyltransferase